MPRAVAEIRREQCPSCQCGTNPDDPCAACPSGRWGQYDLCDQVDPPLPPLPTMASNLMAATSAEAAALLARTPPPSPEEIDRRLAICAKCKHYRASDHRCSKCGCFLSHKTAWRSTMCPVGRW